MPTRRGLRYDGDMSLLITAFGAFEGGWNCSERLLDALEDEGEALAALWGGPVAFVRLPVDTEAIAGHLRVALIAHRPTHLLLMGQAAGRANLSLERIARNDRDLRTPDACGRCGALGPVDPTGPETRDATWPDLEGAVDQLARDGLPVVLSDDAGRHLCNQTLYLALGVESLNAAFLHLPLLPEQAAEGLPAAQGGRPTLPLDDMRRAVRALLLHSRRFAAASAAKS